MHRIASTLAVLTLSMALAACGKSASDTAAAATSESAAPSATASDTATATDAGATPAPEMTAAAAAVTGEPQATADPVVAAAKMPAAFLQCRACHSTEPGKTIIGPTLAGVYGTKAGDVAGFRFSDAMKKSGLTWDDATLDKFLESPMKVVPGTKMTFYGVKNADQRQQIIDYLKTL